MCPVLRSGDTVVAAVPMEIPPHGSIIILQKATPKSGGLPYAHRIIGRRMNPDGTIELWTKGDARSRSDGYCRLGDVLGVTVAINGHSIRHPLRGVCDRMIAFVSAREAGLAEGVRKYRLLTGYFKLALTITRISMVILCNLESIWSRRVHNTRLRPGRGSSTSPNRRNTDPGALTSMTNLLP